MLWAIVLPLGSLIAVAAVMLSLGTIFTLAGNVGTSIIGLGIIAVVPAIGFALTRGSSGESAETGEAAEAEGSSH